MVLDASDPFNRPVDPVALEIHVSSVFCFNSVFRDVNSTFFAPGLVQVCSNYDL